MIIQTITYYLFGRSGLTPGLALARVAGRVFGVVHATAPVVFRPD